jgi:hypothetical protein
MIEETEDYWIYQDYLIFKPAFNKELTNNELLLKYQKIIFSNYHIPSICLKLKNKFVACHAFCSFSMFNRSIDLPNTIEQLNFGYHFNQPLILPTTLTHLTLGNEFNQPINLPNSLIYLSLDECFNQEINLPFGLKYLKLGTNNHRIINNLVNTIEELVLDCNFNLELNNLPNSIRIIKFKNPDYTKNLNSLVDSIEFIRLPTNYNIKILSIPKSLKVIQCHDKYKFSKSYDKHIQIKKIYR